jgi:hypothetical protein
VSVLCNLGGHVVANDGVEAGDKHERLVEESINSLLISLKTLDQVLLERTHTVAQQTGAVKEVADHDGLEDVELKVTLRTSEGNGGLVTKNLATEHGQRLTLGGVDLAGHDGRTGLVLGELELAETAARTRAEETDVLSNLEERCSQGVQLTVCLNDGIVGGKSLELVGGSNELVAGELADLGSNVLGEALEGVETSTDSGTTLSEVAQTGKSGLDTQNAILELSNVARELLAKGQGSGILQVGATNLDDLVESLLLLVHGILEALQGREELLLELENSGNVHGGREGVVGRGGHVDVVIGVDGLLGAHVTAQHLDGAVGDDLVGVHVGLGTGAGLPDDQREVVIELARCDLGGGLLNGLTDLCICAEREASVW